MRPKDILQEEYRTAKGTEHAWVINFVIDADDGLILKSASCQRRIPVHEKLIELGFIQFVLKAKAAGMTRLFPDLVPDRFGKITGNWSKWFGRYIRNECQIMDSKITFHSFRHSFKDISRSLGIPEAEHDAITGHSDGRVARKYGGMNYPLPPLLVAMHRYEVLGISLPDPYEG